jgi:hypothetical protein
MELSRLIVGNGVGTLIDYIMNRVTLGCQHQALAHRRSARRSRCRSSPRRASCHLQPL